jgi:hypothetical protein
VSALRRIVGHCTVQCLLLLAIYVVYTYAIVEAVG